MSYEELELNLLLLGFKQLNRTVDTICLFYLGTPRRYLAYSKGTDSVLLYGKGYSDKFKKSYPKTFNNNIDEAFEALLTDLNRDNADE